MPLTMHLDVWTRVTAENFKSDTNKRSEDIRISDIWISRYSDIWIRLNEA